MIVRILASKNTVLASERKYFITCVFGDDRIKKLLLPLFSSCHPWDILSINLVIWMFSRNDKHVYGGIILTENVGDVIAIPSLFDTNPQIQWN